MNLILVSLIDIFYLTFHTTWVALTDIVHLLHAVELIELEVDPFAEANKNSIQKDYETIHEKGSK